MSFEQKIQEFLDGGNAVVGKPKAVRGKFEIDWTGSGSTIVFGENVWLKDVRIEIGAFSNLRVGKNTALRGIFQIGTHCGIKIGDSTSFNRPSHLTAWERSTIEIGDRCLFSNVTIRTSDMHSIHDVRTDKRLNFPAHVVIEDHVWLGENVSVYKGARVGFGSIVAGSSVVLGSIKPNSVAAGQPAKVVREGIAWKRKPEPTLTVLQCADFEPHDIPVQKDVLQYLIKTKKYRLLIEAVSYAARSKSLSSFPVFAQWYYVRARELLNVSDTTDIPYLKNVLAKSPDHAEALSLLRRLSSKHSNIEQEHHA